MTEIDPGILAHAETLLRSATGERVRARFPLAPLTSFRLGGPAALYLEANDDGDLDAAAVAVGETGLPWTVIGKGSNLLVSDAGFAGLVIRLGKGYRWAARDGSSIRAGGAMPLPALSGVALSHGLAGLEFAVAIPATLGGAVRMNAGAHHGAMDGVVRWVDVFELARRGRLRVDSAGAGFRYRRSELPAASIVVEATLDLHPGDPVAIRHEMEGARAWRRETQPLAEPNCGSVFKNPDGDHAARLVEAAGGKGMAVGGARVSEKHANFVVASRGATASDVWELIGRVQRLVEERFGVSLEREVQLVGDFNGATV